MTRDEAITFVVGALSNPSTDVAAVNVAGGMEGMATWDADETPTVAVEFEPATEDDHDLASDDARQFMAAVKVLQRTRRQR